jgi:polyhydroxyalkanoate synthase
MGYFDAARRQIGNILAASGFGAEETPNRVLLDLPGCRLRAYSHDKGNTGPVLLIIAAPFKRAYIWDLAPEVSVIRHCLREGIRVYLLEWLLPTPTDDHFGLAEYASSWPAAAIQAIEAEAGSSAPILAGHSLGGTFAAICATLFPERIG